MKHTSIGMGIILLIALSSDRMMDKLGPGPFLTLGAIASMTALILIKKGDEENG